nr:hypothetical protein GCM10017611_68980 [Rhodococcus wratislaviensis]
MAAWIAKPKVMRAEVPTHITAAGSRVSLMTCQRFAPSIRAWWRTSMSTSATPAAVLTMMTKTMTKATCTMREPTEYPSATAKKG